MNRESTEIEAFWSAERVHVPGSRQRPEVIHHLRRLETLGVVAPTPSKLTMRKLIEMPYPLVGKEWPNGWG